MELFYVALILSFRACASFVPSIFGRSFHRATSRSTSEYSEAGGGATSQTKQVWACKKGRREKKLTGEEEEIIIELCLKG